MTDTKLASSLAICANEWAQSQRLADLVEISLSSTNDLAVLGCSGMRFDRIGNPKSSVETTNA